MTFDAARVRAQFPALAQANGLHYLDNAATAQVPRPVIDAVAAFDAGGRANVARGVYRLAEAATEAYEGARATVARYLGADPNEIVFAQNATAAINLVAHALGETLQPGDEVVVSRAEHHANLLPWQQLRDRRGIALRVLDLNPEGRIDLDTLDATVTERCRLIAVTHLSNVTGAVTDLATVAAAAKNVGARVLVDGAQMAPRGALDVPGLGVDFYAFSGHKAYGPTGVGVLWARADILDRLPPFLTGGGIVSRVSMEDAAFLPAPARFEAGTPPVAQAVGLAAALDWIETLDTAGAAAHVGRLTGRVLDGLEAIRGTRLLGPAGLQERAGVISFDVAGVHAHDVCQVLDGHGVAVRGGHHCAQPLMDFFGVTGCTRASLAPYNDDADVDALLTGVDDAVRRLG